MSARLIRPLDVIEVTTLPVLIYGGPGVGKTSVAQTAENPCTLDFDKGVHRCQNRKDTYRFDAWQDVLDAGEDGTFGPYKTLVIDTGGKAISAVIQAVLKESAKNGYGGVPSQQGWGQVGRRFAGWVETVCSWGKDLVMVCHEDEGTNAADQVFFKPEFPGKLGYKAVQQNFDVMGRIYYRERKRYIDFSPRENSVGKNAGGFDVVETGDVHKNATFLADLIAQAKRHVGKTAEASAAVTATVAHWTTWLGEEHPLDVFNVGLADLAQLKNGVKRQCWVLIQRHAEKRGWRFDAAGKKFVAASTESRDSVGEEVPA